ncbi:PqqD family protein [Halosimplex litoreum]|uniref:PqqD family protein n=1 Tax=Halosimplex litoreum TaxID=1198301 RepID=A0A7T3G0Y6_9EURY|nr:PqqD family protein [Halosimplex litoreum]QPV64360.1 PqqD family protein [Halosimplex litoreum]
MGDYTDSTTVVAVEDALSTTLDGESVILHTGSGEYFGFNEVGTRIWEAMQEPRSMVEITQQIENEYDVERERCRSDIESLVDELVEQDLARVVDDP